MNKKLVASAGLAIAASAAIYFYKRNRSQNKEAAVAPAHNKHSHRVDAFSRAKKMAGPQNNVA